MSFVWQAAERLLTPEQVMQVIINVVNELNLPDKRGACVIGGMVVAQESDFWIPWNANDPESKNYKYDSQSNDGRSVGLWQQQKSAGGALWWGPTSQEMDPYLSTKEFMTRLKRAGYNASNAQAANDSGQAIQQSGVPQGYKKHWQRANELYDFTVAHPQALPDWVMDPGPSGVDNVKPQPGFSGDPYWLADVLRAEGLKVFEVEGWQNRGQGDQGKFWGVVFHHTGSAGETPEGIAFHPSLGLAAHILIKPNGDVWVCGIGKANHAGVGSWVGIPTDNGNPVLFGVEVAILPVQGAPHRSGWPDVQYDATVKVHAALVRKLGLDSDRVISHQEWATKGPAGWRQGKWDPGAIDMNIFRDDVQNRLDTFSPGGGGEDGFLMALSDNEQRELLDKVRQLWGASFNPVADTSIYGNPDPNHKISNKDRTTFMDGNVWDGRVEELARNGVGWAIEAVVRTAAGQGPLGDTKWAVDQATDILEDLAKSNPEVLKTWDPEAQ